MTFPAYEREEWLRRGPSRAPALAAFRPSPTHRRRGSSFVAFLRLVSAPTWAHAIIRGSSMLPPEPQSDLQSLRRFAVIRRKGERRVVQLGSACACSAEGKQTDGESDGRESNDDDVLCKGRSQRNNPPARPHQQTVPIPHNHAHERAHLSALPCA